MMHEKYNHRYADDRENHRLNMEIEHFVEAYDGTAIGQSIRNMYENDSSYEAICDRMGLDYDDYKE